MRFTLALTLPLILAVAAPAGAASEDITAVGQRQHDGQWLSLTGSERTGAYSVRIRISDLDPSTRVGWHEMARRVETGTWRLCDAVQDGPRFAGYSDATQRDCWIETRGIARAQMNQARDAARGGQSLAFLNVSRF